MNVPWILAQAATGAQQGSSNLFSPAYWFGSAGASEQAKHTESLFMYILWVNIISFVLLHIAPGDPGWVKGSARSVPGVHIRDVLDALAKRQPGLLERFGGHAMAAGMTIPEESLDDFRAAFEAEVARWVEPETLAGDLLTDGELESGEFSWATALALREGGPWGASFPEPAFDGRFGLIESRVVGERHLKLRLRTSGGEALDGIAFRYLDDPSAPQLRGGDAIEMVYRLTPDEYRGNRRVQLVSEWLGPGSPPEARPAGPA